MALNVLWMTNGNKVRCSCRRDKDAVGSTDDSSHQNEIYTMDGQSSMILDMSRRGDYTPEEVDSMKVLGSGYAAVVLVSSPASGAYWDAFLYVDKPSL